MQVCSGNLEPLILERGLRWASKTARLVQDQKAPLQAWPSHPPQLLVIMIAQPWQGSEMGSLCTGSLPASWHCLAPFAWQLSPPNAPGEAL